MNETNVDIMVINKKKQNSYYENILNFFKILEVEGLESNIKKIMKQVKMYWKNYWNVKRRFLKVNGFKERWQINY